eukprot:GSA120T00000266001.1
MTHFCRWWYCRRFLCLLFAISALPTDDRSVFSRYLSTSDLDHAMCSVKLSVALVPSLFGFDKKLPF